jgi:peroxiredoxin
MTMPRAAHAPLSPGQTFPDVDLLDHAGNRRRLSELAGGDPAVLQFFPRLVVPKEQAFFRRLVALQNELEVAYSRVLSITVVAPGEISRAIRPDWQAPTP